MKQCSLALILFAGMAGHTVAQQLDSVHVFKWVPDGQQTLASAHTLAWTFHRGKEPYTTLEGVELQTVA